MINVRCSVFNPKDQERCAIMVHSSAKDRRTVLVHLFESNGKELGMVEVFGHDLIQAVENCMETGISRQGYPRGFIPDYTSVTREDE